MDIYYIFNIYDDLNYIKHYIIFVINKTNYKISCYYEQINLVV